MTIRRAAENPIITPSMLRPSRPDYEVIGVFNPGCTTHHGDTLLLLRVAEAPVADGDEILAPWFDVESGDLKVRRWARNSAGVVTTDPRVIVADGQTWLTSISHFRVARSRDGIHFAIGDAPAMSAANALESFGIEDARITLLDGTYWINYSAVSPRGIATALASTRDFVTFERHGVIFAPPNRDATVFPEKVHGRYVALHRPMPEGIGDHAIWIATSPDLLSWGEHRYVAGARLGGWDDAKVGGGAVPFRVRVGGKDAWIAIYHGVRAAPLQYALGALLLDADDPGRVLARSREPVLAPEASYERHGFFDGVVFTCGVLVDGDRVRVYYGAADGVTAVADLSLETIIAGLE